MSDHTHYFKFHNCPKCERQFEIGYEVGAKEYPDLTPCPDCGDDPEFDAFWREHEND